MLKPSKIGNFKDKILKTYHSGQQGIKILQYFRMNRFALFLYAF